MAIGKKTGGRDFKKGWKGGPGKPKLSPEAKQLKKLTADEYILRVTKYLHLSKADLKKSINDENIDALDWFIRNSIIKGIEKGNYSQLDSMLDRIIGKVKSEMQLSGKLEANVENKEKVYISDRSLEAIGDAIVRAKTENSQ